MLEKLKQHFRKPESKDPGHVFVWYMNNDGHVVVLDNDQCLTLEKGDGVEEYIKANKPGYYATFNDRVK